MAEVENGRGPDVTLAIGGMTCASCAARVERRLNKLDGVVATVNFATEQAGVQRRADVPDTDLVAAVEAAGYRARVLGPAGTSAEPGPAGTSAPSPAGTPFTANAPSGTTPRDRLLVSAALAIPVIVLAMVPALQFRNWQWLSLALAAPVVVWGAWPFHRSAAVSLAHGTATMDTLVSLGVLAAFGWSLYALFIGDAGMAGLKMPFDLTLGTGGMDQIYLEAATGVTVFVLAGRALEARAKRRAGAALEALVTLGAREATVLRHGAEVKVPIDQLAVGDTFVVRPGEKVATDGVVVDGSSALDVSLLTGEPVPVDVGPGDPVTGATVNTWGRLAVRASRVGADTELAQIARLVTDAQQGKAPVQRLADRVAAVFVPVVVILAVATLVGWLATGRPAADAFAAAVAVLIVACPCALGLATPTALLVGSGRGAQLGILIKGPEVLESTRRVDTVVLDKTGTVTTGELRVVQTVPAPGGRADDVLGLAAAVEDGSEHPVGRAIVAEAQRLAESQPQAETERFPQAEQLRPLPPVVDFASIRGLGVTGEVDGHAVVVGQRRLLAERGIHIPPALSAAQEEAERAGQTVVWVARDDQPRGIVVLGDTLRPTSSRAVADLRRLGLTPWLVTGDQYGAARQVAERVGVDPDHVIAQVLPADKQDVVRRLQADGRVVAVVGDGVNDAGALAQADLGLAMGSGTDVAVEASDLTLIRADLGTAVDAVRLSRRTLGTIKGNLFWAFCYNAAAIPLAMVGLVNPMIAGAAMAFSSVFVVSNSLRLRRFRSTTPA